MLRRLAATGGLRLLSRPPPGPRRCLAAAAAAEARAAGASAGSAAAAAAAAASKHSTGTHASGAAAAADVHSATPQPFLAETRKLLHIMSQSLYTDKEVFVRELIANSSDALEKMRFMMASGEGAGGGASGAEAEAGTAGVAGAVTASDAGAVTDSDAGAAVAGEGAASFSGAPLEVSIEVNPRLGTISISDNGVGMSGEEMARCLGTIGHSGKAAPGAAARAGGAAAAGGGSAAFSQMTIGQFGVGFYSTFVVSSSVEAVSRAAGSPRAFRWYSEGEEGFSVSEVTPNFARGTRVTCTLKPDCRELVADAARVRRLVDKFAPFSAYPIRLRIWTESESGREGAGAEDGRADSPSGAPAATSSDGERDGGAAVSATPAAGNWEETLLNAGGSGGGSGGIVNPLWSIPPATDADHERFFDFLRAKEGAGAGGSRGGDRPREKRLLYVVPYRTDAPVSLRAVLYVPAESGQYRTRASRHSERAAVDLYCKRMLVARRPEGLLPTWLNFLVGAVDCEDAPLNVSRESLQDQRLLARISSVLVKKLLRRLETEAKREPEQFARFWREFGTFLKEGLVTDGSGGGASYKKELTSLLRFPSTLDPKALLSLDRYVDMTHPEMKSIYYFSASTVDLALQSPYVAPFASRGIPVLILTEEIDDFAAMHVGEFRGRKLVAVDMCDDAVLQKDLALVEPRPDGAAGKEAAAAAAAELTDAERTRVLDFFRSTLDKKLSAVEFCDSLPLSAHAVAHGFLPASLRKMMKAVVAAGGGGGAGGGTASSMFDTPVALKLNARSPVFAALHAGIAAGADNEAAAQAAATVARQIFANAAVAAGMVEDPRTLLPQLRDMVELCAGARQPAAAEPAAAAERASAGPAEELAAEPVSAEPAST